MTALPHLLEAGANIVNVSSIAGVGAPADGRSPRETTGPQFRFRLPDAVAAIRDPGHSSAEIAALSRRMGSRFLPTGDQLLPSELNP
jgi:NAD(P)-dependent dehydrogenase (short-subunit alcohol dehydrogenase family)